MITNLYLNRSGAKRVREKRKLKYEAKQRYETIIAEALTEFDNLLTNSTLSEEQREQLLQQKQEFEQQSQLVIKNMELDFNLH